MGKIVDHTGKIFGKLIAIERIPSKGSKTKYLCQCDCGNEKIVSSSNLVTGHSTSCGCSVTKHGFARKERLYNIWIGMKQRCRDSNSKDFIKYGGRGIKVNPIWESDYLSFRSWAIENGYNNSLSIDRIDVDGNYEPDNCRWVDEIQQQNNKSDNHFITYKGHVHTIAEWARILNISSNTLKTRLSRGWTIERIMTTPILERGVQN